jgi:hypothetical protein
MASQLALTELNLWVEDGENNDCGVSMYIVCHGFEGSLPSVHDPIVSSR